MNLTSSDFMATAVPTGRMLLPSLRGHLRALVLASVSISPILLIVAASFAALNSRTVQDLTASTIGGENLAASSCPSENDVATVDTTKLRTVGGEVESPFRLRANEYALTFDDGPMAWTTPHIARLLKAECVPATFFMIGRHAQMFPRIVATIESGGFSIGSHTYRHASLAEMSREDAQAEILAGMKAVETGGHPPRDGRLFRFPNGAFTPELLDDVHALGATAVFSDISAEDWRGQPTSESFALFRERLAKTDRGIIVLHDTQFRTVELLPMVIEEVRRRGGRFVELVPGSSPDRGGEDAPAVAAASSQDVESAFTREVVAQ